MTRVAARALIKPSAEEGREWAQGPIFHPAEGVWT